MIAKSNEVTKELITPYGTKYIIEGEFLPPSGTKVRILTVWLIESNDDRPRFVTAYPV